MIICMLLGVALGTPIGGLLATSFQENRCGDESCHGRKSSVCIDGLCSRHCRDLHNNKCTKAFIM
jgi:hypothetical protein